MRGAVSGAGGLGSVFGGAPGNGGQAARAGHHAAGLRAAFDALKTPTFTLEKTAFGCAGERCMALPVVVPVLAVGLCYEVESDVKMAVGDSTTVRGYQFTFQGVKNVPGPNYEATRAHIVITKGGSGTLGIF